MIQIVCYSNSSRTVAFRTHYWHAYQVRYNSKMSPLIYYTFLYLLLYQKWGHLGPFGDSTLVRLSQMPSSEAHPFPVISPVQSLFLDVLYSSGFCQLLTTSVHK